MYCAHLWFDHYSLTALQYQHRLFDGAESKIRCGPHTSNDGNYASRRERTGGAVGGERLFYPLLMSEHHHVYMSLTCLVLVILRVRVVDLSGTGDLVCALQQTGEVLDLSWSNRLQSEDAAFLSEYLTVSVQL